MRSTRSERSFVPEMRLASIATIHGGGRLRLSGRDFVDEGFSAYGAAGINGRVRVAEYRDTKAVVLSAVGARCGKAFFADGDWTSLANTLVILPDLSKVEPRFLWYQLNDESRWPRSGSAQPFIKPSDVRSHEVWVPDRSTQMRVVAELDAVSLLRSLVARRAEKIGVLRRQMLRQEFESIRPGDYRSRRLGEVCSPKQWPTLSRAEMRTAGFPVYGANGIIGYHSEFNHRDPVLLVGCRGTIGSIHITKPMSYATGNAMALDNVDQQVVLMHYLAAFLAWRGFDDVTSGSSQPQLTRQSLINIEVPVVDMETQERISIATEKLNEVNDMNGSELSLADLLMDVSRRRAFRGEL